VFKGLAEIIVFRKRRQAIHKAEAGAIQHLYQAVFAGITRYVGKALVDLGRLFPQ
jgi:hypothetical protein